MNILFVDDDVIFLMDIKKKLKKKLKNVIISCVHSAKEAINKISKDEIDIVVTDYKMPHVNGVQLLNIIETDYPKVERIILTGYPEVKEMNKIENEHFYYLEKPCMINDFVDTIKMAMSN